MLLIVLLALAFAADTTTCDKKYMSEKDGKCVECYGDYLNEKGDDCVVPQTIQEGCVGNKVTSTSCTGSCTDFYYKKDGKCIKGSIEHCVSYDDEKKCSYCEEGYAVKYNDNEKKENSTCVEAKGGCLIVDANDEKKCIYCYGEIKDGECKDDKPSIENCEVQETDKTTTNSKTYCHICKEGYVCNKADNECSSCEKVENKVEKCLRYEKLSGTDTDTIVCSKCEEGYHPEIDKDAKNSTCVDNFEHCEKQNTFNKNITDEKNECTQCENKYAIQDKDGKADASTCVATEIEYCLNIDKDKKCYECWSGYGLTKEGKCEKCKDSNAASCSLDLETSYSCKGSINYALDNKECKKVNNLASVKKYAELSASVSMTVMLFVVLFLLF